MKCTLDGHRIHDLLSFIRELTLAVREATGEEHTYFGSNVRALHDCLHGGFGGEPPYEIEVLDAEAMVAAMSDVEAIDYRDDVLQRLDPGEVQPNTRTTPLDELFDVVDNAPAELILRSSSGEVLRRSRPVANDRRHGSLHPIGLEARLRSVSDSAHLVAELYRIVEELDAGSPDLSTVRTILRFMEEQPDLDLGTPGPLVHFVERFLGAGYEAELYASLARRPTAHTVWMLNRVINVTTNVGERERLILLLERARHHPAADASARHSVDFFLEALGR